MPKPVINTGEFWEGSNFRFLDRIVGLSQAPLTSDDVTSWKLRVFDPTDRKDGKTLVDQTDSTGFEDELRTDLGWSRDGTGWNFSTILTPSIFKAEGGHRYRFEIVAVTENDGDVPSVWLLSCKELGSR